MIRDNRIDTEPTLFPRTHQSVCEVCGATVHYPDTLEQKHQDYFVCRAFECRRIMGQKATMAPALFDAHLAFQKKLLADQRNKAARKKLYIDAVTRNEQAENRLIFQQVVQQHPQLSEANTLMVTLPSGLSESRPPRQARIENYTEHLQQIIEAALAHDNADEVVYDQHHAAHEKLQVVEQQFSDHPGLRDISDRLCSQCKGGCCPTGKDHAYLSVVTIRRYLDQHPRTTADALLATYLSCLGEESIEGACINQTSRGCALPRELRSDVCNMYYCESVKNLQQELVQQQAYPPVVAIQRANTNWNRFDPDTDNGIKTAILVSGDSVEDLNHLLKSDREEY